MIGSGTHSSRGGSILSGCVAFAIIGLGTLAWAQDRGAAIAKDAIFARKILMDTIGTNMDELEGMVASGKPINVTEAHEHADMISVMLMAFPHLFGADTNQWKPDAERDPGRDTYAAPELFINYADFYAQAARASKIAYNASRARQERDFKTFVAELRTACDSCHAVYLKTDR